MLFNNGKSSIFAVIFAVLLTLFNLEMEPEITEMEATYLGNSKFLFDYLTNLRNIPKYFTLITQIRFKEEIFKGQKFSAKTWFGNEEEIQVTQFDSLKKIATFQSDSVLKPILTLQVLQAEENRAKVKFSVKFNRKSAFFQYTLGLMARFVLKQQFKHCFLTIKWILPNVAL